jgi:hypothetical protein
MQFHGYKAIAELLTDKNNPTIIEDKIIDWLVALRKEDASFKMAFNTRHGYLAAVLTFYEINDVNIRKKKVARYLGEEVKRKQKDRAYTVEEIKKLLDYADLRSKVKTRKTTTELPQKNS